jgi:hypothetical protein
MAPKLADDQRQALDEQGGCPLCVVDARTNARYVLLREERYENLKALSVDNEEVDPRALYPLTAKSAAAAGWDDPEMDVYNGDDAHKKSSE